MSILAGDIGGTKTALGLFERRPDGSLDEVRSRKFRSGDFDGLAPIVEQFLGAASHGVEAAAFGVAGPVVNNTATLTNLPWALEGDVLAAATGIPRVDLLNDLVATAEGIPALPPEAVRTLQAGDSAVSGNGVLIAAGTGLGMALLPWVDGRWRPMASEGGHQCFAPRNRLEWELETWLAERLGGRISIERVVSGLGLVDLYRFLASREGATADAAVRASVDSPGVDAARAIAEAADADTCPVARRAIEMFVSLYGSVTGDLALVGLAFGGVWVGGGIAPRLLPWMESGRFIEAYLNKGRFRGHLERMPVRVILDDRAALLGAAAHAARAAAEVGS